MGQEAFLYGMIQALVFALPVAGILIYFGRKLQKVETLESNLSEHLKGSIDRDKARREEINNVFKKVNAVSETVNFIKGKLEGLKP